MRLIAWNSLRDVGARNPRAAASLGRLRSVIEAASWRSTDDVLASFSKAKTCGSCRVRFEVDGGNFRLIIGFNFQRQIAFVKFIGAHTEYDRIDASAADLF